MTKGSILVTGASSGVGRACAVHFARLGYRVLAGVRDPRVGEALAAAAPGVEPLLLDVTEPNSLRRAADMLGGEPLNALINNAGISAMGPVELVPLETWRGQFEVNVIGVVAVTQAFLPHLRRSKGRIVNIGSIAGRSALPGTAAYDSTKFALRGLTDSLRLEMQPFGIEVSLVEPGAVATAIWDKAIKQIDDLDGNADRHLYDGLISALRRETVKAAAHALPAETVAKAVEHAVTARRPRARYVIGADARFWLMLNLLPVRWKDRLILSGLNSTRTRGPE